LSVAQKTPGIFRLVSPALTTGVKTGSLNDNVTFNTNIPFTSLAMRIWRIRYMRAFSAWVGFTNAASDNVLAQFFSQLTENQTKTSVVTTDSSYLDQDVFQIALTQNAATAASIDSTILKVDEYIHDFNQMTSPWTVATKLNFVETMVNTGSANLDAGNIFKSFITVEYTLETLTADLHTYLSRRLQIQGS
jgi:hypothetical protein